MIISMRPWGTPGIRSLQSISGTAAVVKGRFHVPSDLQRVLTKKGSILALQSTHSSAQDVLLLVLGSGAICLVSLPLLECSIRGTFD